MYLSLKQVKILPMLTFHIFMWGPFDLFANNSTCTYFIFLTIIHNIFFTVIFPYNEVTCNWTRNMKLKCYIKLSLKNIMNSNISTCYVPRLPSHVRLSTLSSSLVITPYLTRQFVIYSWLSKHKTTKCHDGYITTISYLPKLLLTLHLV